MRVWYDFDLMIASLLLFVLQDDWTSLRSKLASDDSKVRAEAQEQLKKITDRKLLKERLASEADAEVKAALQNAIAALPVFELKIEKLESGYKVRIKNVSDETVVAVRSLDGSGMKARYPHYLVEFYKGEKRLELPPVAGCGNCNPITQDDLVTLKAGEEFDPFMEGAFGNYHLQAWQAPGPGKYTVKMICDFSAPELPHFNGPMERMNGLGGLEGRLKKVPKVRFEGKVEFEVKP